MRWLYALGVDHPNRYDSKLLNSSWMKNTVIGGLQKWKNRPVNYIYIHYIYMYMYVYTYWFRFHLPGSNASAHIKLMCSFILLQDVTPPGDWLDVAFQKSPMTMGQSDGIRRAILWYFIQKALHLGNPPLHPQGSASWPRAPYLSQVASGKWLKFTPWSIAEHIHI